MAEVRLINAEALKEKWKEECCGCCENCSHCATGLNCDLIDNAPTVEPEREKVPIANITFDEKKLKELTDEIVERIKNGEIVLKYEWIPVSERLPDDETEVLIQYGQSIMVGYHKFDFATYPTEFEDANDTGWYSSTDNFICGSDEVIAWQPLPDPYKKGGTE